MPITKYAHNAVQHIQYKMYKYILRMNVRALLCNLSLHLLTLEFIFQLVFSLN